MKYKYIIVASNSEFTDIHSNFENDNRQIWCNGNEPKAIEGGYALMYEARPVGKITTLLKIERIFKPKSLSDEEVKFILERNEKYTEDTSKMEQHFHNNISIIETSKVGELIEYLSPKDFGINRDYVQSIDYIKDQSKIRQLDSFVKSIK